VVAAGLADRCTLQLSYAIGVAKPLSIYVDLHGTGKVDEGKLEDVLMDAMDLSPRGIRTHLGLNRPIYARTSAYGHFGRKPDADGGFSWERTDLADRLKAERGGLGPESHRRPRPEKCPPARRRRPGGDRRPAGRLARPGHNPVPRSLAQGAPQQAPPGPGRNVAEIGGCLNPAGALRFVTDWADYAEWALERFAHARTDLDGERADDWNSPRPITW
jgi:hypothetical protein